MNNQEFKYEGGELELFKHAVHWKQYFTARLRPLIRKRVIEVGAGIGATTTVLCDGHQEQWLCVEPDGLFAAALERSSKRGELPACCSVRCGTIDSAVPNGEFFDTVLYIDVLEHIEFDREELVKASSVMADDGTLVVLAPAYEALFSPFDAAVGHFRRYTRSQLKALTPPGLRFVKGYYLDSVGCLASLVNRILLKQAAPRERQIDFWDQRIVPVSRVVDRLVGYSFGRSVVGIWKRS